MLIAVIKGRGSLMGFRRWSGTVSDTTEATQQQLQRQQNSQNTSVLFRLTPMVKGVSLVAQMVKVKNLPAMRVIWVRSLDWEGPLEKGMGTYSSILAWRIPCTVAHQSGLSMGSQRVRHN